MGYTNPSDRDSLRCSFCGKAEATVGKLISSPTAHPRAYICNECVAICASIIADDQAPPEPVTAEPHSEPHPLLSHPQASELLAAMVEWIRHESLGRDASEELAEVRSIAARMIADASR